MSIFFNKKKTPAIATPTAAIIPENHVSNKKKNTYQIEFSCFFDATLFQLCPSTPLGVICFNGKNTPDNTGWLKCTNFPNPCAYHMAENHSLLNNIMGNKLSTQIIEYLDKETGQPVLQLYPDMLHVFNGFEDNFISRLNHASRRDFERQLQIRKNLIENYKQK